jgi:putative tricarboxylic transport membrane protein
MKTHDRLSGLFLLAISIFVCVESIKVNIGSFHSPGPGFLPFWGGFILGTLAIVLVVKSILSKRKETQIITNLWKGMKWSKVIWISVFFFVYALLLPKLGYLLATFGLMTFLFGVIGKTRIWVQVVTAIITVVASYLIFYVWLQVQLPKGISIF